MRNRLASIIAAYVAAAFAIIVSLNDSKALGDDLKGNSSAIDLLAFARSQYSPIQAFHSKATIVQQFNATLFNMPEKNVVLHTSFEYWKERDRFRIESFANPEDAPGVDSVVVYDGNQWEWLQVASKMIAIWSKREDGMTLLPPNPALAPMEFVWGQSSTKPKSIPQWEDVLSKDADARIAAAKVLSSTELSIMGGDLDGQQISYDIRLDEKTGLVSLLRIINVASGKPIVISEFSYEAILANGKTRYFPSKITSEYTEPTSNGKATSSTDVTILPPSVPISEAKFAIDARLAKSVYDLDNKQLSGRGSSTMPATVPSTSK